jgi:hypothetical protein
MHHHDDTDHDNHHDHDAADARTIAADDRGNAA